MVSKNDLWSIVKKPKIIAFDDSFSAIDTETEELILSQIKGRKEKPTSIIVSHRISTLKHADLILVIDEGKIIAQGSHEDLMKKSEFYKDLNDKQV